MEMEIDIALPNTVTVTCPASKATAAILKEIGGWKFNGQEWSFPLVRLEELCKMFPRAQLTESAAQWFVPKSAIRIEAARALCERLNAVGISVIWRYDPGWMFGRVCAVFLDKIELPPQTWSPVLLYMDEIKTILDNGEDFTVRFYGNVPVQPEIKPENERDNSLEAKMLRGWKNAAEAEKRQAAMIVNRYRKSKRKDKQMEMII